MFMPTRILIGPSSARSSGSISVVQKATPSSVCCPDESVRNALKCGGEDCFGEKAVAVGKRRSSCTSVLPSRLDWPARITEAPSSIDPIESVARIRLFQTELLTIAGEYLRFVAVCLKCGGFAASFLGAQS